MTLSNIDHALDRNSLESQLAAAQKQIQILHQRLCSARAMHCRVEGTAHFVNTSAGAWNSFDILSVDEVRLDFWWCVIINLNVLAGGHSMQFRGRQLRGQYEWPSSG